MQTDIMLATVHITCKNTSEFINFRNVHDIDKFPYGISRKWMQKQE